MNKPTNPSLDRMLWTIQKEEGHFYTAKRNTMKPAWFKYLMIFLAMKIIVIIAVLVSMATYGAIREAKQMQQRNTEITDSLNLYRSAYNLKKLQP